MVVPILIYVFLCAFISYLGRRQRFGFWGYFFCSILLSPLIGLLLVVAASGRPRA